MKGEIKRIRETFPDLKFSRVKDASHGIDHVALILDGKYVFRFPRKANNERKIGIEMKFLDELYAKGLKVPNYEWNGGNFGGYRLIKGEPLSASKYKRIRNKDELHKELAHFFTILHSYKTFPGLKKEPDYYLEFEKKKKVFEKHLTPEQMKFSEEVIRQIKKFKVPNKRVAHGDMYSEHILYDKGFAGIIDFTDFYIGDPAIDFQDFWDYGEDAVKDIYRRYKGPKDPDFLYRSHLHSFVNVLGGLYDGATEKNKQRWLKGSKASIDRMFNGELVLL